MFVSAAGYGLGDLGAYMQVWLSGKQYSFAALEKFFLSCLTLFHLERPKPHCNLAILSAIGLNDIQILCLYDFERHIACHGICLTRLACLTLVLLNQDGHCLSKQCRSRSDGFFRSHLIRIYTVVHSVCEFI